MSGRPTPPQRPASAPPTLSAPPPDQLAARRALAFRNARPTRDVPDCFKGRHDGVVLVPTNVSPIVNDPHSLAMDANDINNILAASAPSARPAIARQLASLGMISIHRKTTAAVAAIAKKYPNLWMSSDPRYKRDECSIGIESLRWMLRNCKISTPASTGGHAIVAPIPVHATTIDNADSAAAVPDAAVPDAAAPTAVPAAAAPALAAAAPALAAAAPAAAVATTKTDDKKPYVYRGNGSTNANGFVYGVTHTTYQDFDASDASSFYSSPGKVALYHTRLYASAAALAATTSTAPIILPRANRSAHMSAASFVPPWAYRRGDLSETDSDSESD